MPRHSERNLYTALHSPIHFNIAYRSAKENSVNPDNAIVAIVFSAAGIETFMNDLSHISGDRGVEGDHNVEVVAFSNMSSDLEKSRANVMSQIQILGAVFTGKPFTRGSGFLQETNLLIKLRNELLHARPDVVCGSNEIEASGTKKVERILQQLSDRGLIERRNRQYTQWARMICTGEVAKWSYCTAIEVVEEISSVLPRSGMLQYCEHVLANESGRKDSLCE